MQIKPKQWPNQCANLLVNTASLGAIFTNDCVRQRGAMQALSSDNTQCEVSNRAKEVLRTLVIDDWQNKACNPNQQFFKRWWGVIKGLVKAILDWSGAHTNEWFVILLHVICFRNCASASSLGNITPIEKLTGHTPNISIMMQMPCWQPVFYLATGEDVKFPSKPHERFGYFVRFS